MFWSGFGFGKPNCLFAFDAGCTFPTLSTGCTFSCTCYQLNCSPCLAPTTFFPRSALLYPLYVLPLLASAACFTALGTGCVPSSAWHSFFFTCLDNGCMHFCVYHKLHAYQRSATSACFSTLCTAGLHVLLRLAPIICTFSRA